MSGVARLWPALLAASALTLAACDGDSSSPPPPPPPPPAAPTGLTATAADSAVSLAWDAVAGATSYNVYRSATGGQPLGSMILAGTTIHPEFNAAAANGTTWYFLVTAANAGGESPPSGEVSATPEAALAPPAPAGVTAAAGNGSVTVAWDAVPAATSYRVYYGTSPGVTKGASFKACTSSPCTVSSLTNGTAYYFAVSAFISAEESALSTEVMATPRVLPYIDASATMIAPGSILGLGTYSVKVCADSTCNAPIGNATASIGGTALTYDGTDTYEGSPSASIAGRTLQLVVTIPEGTSVASGTYRASGTMYTQAPKFTSPTSGTSWSASTNHTMTWTPGAPTGSSSYGLVAANMANPFSGLVFAQVPVSQTSYAIPAGSLVAGSYLASVQIVPTGGALPIPNTQAGSGFTLTAGDMIFFNVGP